MLNEYLLNPMVLDRDLLSDGLPLRSEAHMNFWRDLCADTEGLAIDKLQVCLPQLKMQIYEGVSQSEQYKDTVLRGVPFEEAGFETIAKYQEPEAIKLWICLNDAGSLPVIQTSNYLDFVHLNRAMAHKCEPVEIVKGIHAVFVAGLPNPGRLKQNKDQWEAGGMGRVDGESWSDAMTRLMQEDKTHFYDKIILMHNVPYGDVSADKVKLSEKDWLDKSSALRLEHEMTHYTTNRMLRSFRLNIHDELLADFMGFTKSLGFFTADLFFPAMGISDNKIPQGCRFRNYVQELDESEKYEVLALASSAANNLEKLSNLLPVNFSRTALLLLLSNYGIEAMGDEDFASAVKERFSNST